MTFAQPFYLLLLAVPLALIAFEFRRDVARVSLPFDHAPRSGRRLPRALLGALLTAAHTLPALMLAAGVLMLAQPQVEGDRRTVREMRNIELCLDVSGSMTASFGEGDRYDAAMGAIERFTGRREGDAFGLTIFGNEVLRWIPLTPDLSAIRTATPFLRPELLPSHFGGTEIGKGLLYCRDTLAMTAGGDRMIILLSDGYSADLGGDRPAEIGAELRAADIELFSIFIGSGEAPDQLYGVTEPTGGQVFAVDDPRGLEAVFDRIDAMRPARFEPRDGSALPHDGPFALAGLLAAALALLCAFGWRYSPW